MNEYYLTNDGLKKCQKEYEELKKELKEKKELKANKMEDELWRPEDQNPEFEMIQTDIDLIEEKIKKIEEVLKNAKIIKKSTDQAPQKVTMGKTVVVELNGEIEEFTIVGTIEADPTNGKISNESPLGKALLGKKVGEIVTIKTSVFNHTYKIIKIK